MNIIFAVNWKTLMEGTEFLQLANESAICTFGPSHAQPGCKHDLFTLIWDLNVEDRTGIHVRTVKVERPCTFVW